MNTTRTEDRSQWSGGAAGLRWLPVMVAVVGLVSGTAWAQLPDFSILPEDVTACDQLVDGTADFQVAATMGFRPATANGDMSVNIQTDLTVAGSTRGEPDIHPIRIRFRGFSNLACNATPTEPPGCAAGPCPGFAVWVYKTARGFSFPACMESPPDGGKCNCVFPIPLPAKREPSPAARGSMALQATVTIDPYNSIAESDEGNNTATHSIPAESPCLRAGCCTCTDVCTCAVTTLLECQESLGRYTPTDTSCGTACPVVGACCGTAGCLEITEEECELGPTPIGKFRDPFTTCAEECPEDIPAVSEWGLVALTLLVLAAGTVVILRRRARVAGA